MRARNAVGFVAAMTLAAPGCSWADDESAAPAAKPIVPPLVAVNRSLPESVFGRAIGERFGEACIEITLSGEERPCSADAKRMFAAEDEHGRPRPGTVVRAIAELRLERPEALSQRAMFLVFASRELGACFAVVTAPATADLQCDATARCPAVCLGASTEDAGDALRPNDPGTGTYLLLSGTVPTETEAVRLSFDDGSTRLYAVTGPGVPGLRGRRVFMADLGTTFPPARVELLAGGEVTASVGWRRMVASSR